MSLGADARPRRCPGSARARRPGTRVSGTPLTRRPSMRSSRCMRQAQQARYGHRLNGLIVVLWRAGLRINEALALTETDLDQRRGSILVRHGKNDRRREVGVDAWAWSALQPWLAERAKLPVGPLFCVIAGPTRGHAWSASAARLELHRIAIDAGVRRRMAPHQLAPCAPRRAAARGDPAAADPAPARPRVPVDDRHLPAGHLLRGDHLTRARAPRAARR